MQKLLRTQVLSNFIIVECAPHFRFRTENYYQCNIWYFRAGRNLNPDKLFAAGSDNYQAYAVANHRHYPEMLQQVKSVNNKIDLLFVPHLSSIERGIYSTHYITIKKLGLDKIYNIYREYYEGCEFVKIVDQTYPKLSQVKQTNDCMISIFIIRSG